MNSRGFVILLVFAVAASIACGLIVERYTAPGLERTFWFAVGLAAIIFPAGWFAEKRGWVKGVWRASEPLGGRAPDQPSLLTPAIDLTPGSAPASASASAPASATRQPSGESK